MSQRLNGKLSGRVTAGDVEVHLDLVDVHGYVVPDEGRVYLSISPTPPRAGWALVMVSPLVSVFGWLFALEQQNHQNGFSITGKTQRRVFSH